MAARYLKHWRKCKSAVLKLAEIDSDDESIMNTSECDEPESLIDSSSDDNFSMDVEGYNITCSDTEDEQEIIGMADASADDRAEPLDMRSDVADWAVSTNQPHSSVNWILKIMAQHGHNELPKDARTLLSTPKVVERQAKCNGEYIYYGLERGIRRILAQCPAVTDINLCINVDGIPVFKSNNSQFWPMLAQIHSFEPFVVCLFSGLSKPNPLEEYVEDLVSEIQKLQNNGIDHNGKVLGVHVRAFICDAPARAYLKSIISHTGYSSCERCEIRGEWAGKVVFNSKANFTRRTDEKFHQVAYKEHQTGVTPLIRAGINCVSTFVLDYMHLVCLGVVKRVCSYLLRTPNQRRLAPRQRVEISNRLVALRNAMPSEFARKPRSLHEMERWKATEFRQFMLYTGPVVLRGIVDEDIYNHFLCLTIGMSILLDSDRDRRRQYLDYAGELLAHFVDCCSEIYGSLFTVYNVHTLKHLHEDVITFDCSLNEVSSFPFENHLRIIKKHVQTSHNPLVQVAKRMTEKALSQRCQKQKKTPHMHVSTRKRDCCFLLVDDSIAFLREKRPDGTLLCDVIQEHQTSDFFETPCNSKLLNIFFVQNISRNAKRCLLKCSDLKKKAVCLPYGGGHTIFPLLHGTE